MVAVVLVPAPFRPEEWVVNYGGALVPRVAPGYEPECSWVGDRWVLSLKRPSEEPALFDVKVRHLEGGTAHHEEFRQDGRTVTIDYPGDFNMSQMPQPHWGEYRVFWAVPHPDGRRDNIEGSFTWEEPGASV